MTNITIYRNESGEETDVLTIPLNDRCIYNNVLMSTQHVILNFNSLEYDLLQIGDYIQYDGVKYTISELTPPDCITGGYQYNQKFVAPWMLWAKRKLLFDRSGSPELGWKMTQYPQYFLELIIETISEFGNYTYETSDETDYMTLCNFEPSVDVVTALNTMCDNSHWSTEWWIDEQSKVLHFGVCELPTNTKPIVTLTDGDEVSSVTRNQAQNANKTTRLYAFGSTKNISPYYRRDLIFTAGATQNDINNADAIAQSYGYQHGVIDSTRRITNKSFTTAANVDADILNVDVTWDGAEFSNIKLLNTSDIIANNKVANKRKIVIREGVIKISSLDLELAEQNSGLINQLSPSYNYDIDVEIIAGKTKQTFNKHGVGITKKVTLNFRDQEVLLDEFVGDIYLKVTINSASNDVTINASNFKVDVYPFTTKALTKIRIGSNEYDAVVNPYGVTDYEEASSIVCYNGNAISRGQTYRLANILNKNVPSSYYTDKIKAIASKVAEARLMLPEGTKCINLKSNMRTEEIVEGMLIFEDIFPRQQGNSIDLIFKSLDTVEYNDAGQEVLSHVYNVVDEGLVFSNDYKIKDQDLQITFQSGDLRGMTFKVTYHDNEYCSELEKTLSWFRIEPNDSYGMTLPKAGYEPATGDTYILSGFDTSYVDEKLTTDAEEELLQAAKQIINELPKDTSTYDCQMNVVKEFGIARQLGQRVNFVSARYGTYDSRIRGIEKTLSDTSIKYTIGAYIRYSRNAELLAFLNQGKAAQLTIRGNLIKPTGSYTTTYGEWKLAADVSSLAANASGDSIQLKGRAYRTVKKTWQNNVSTYSSESRDITWLINDDNEDYCNVEDNYLLISVNGSDEDRTITVTAKFQDGSSVLAKVFNIQQPTCPMIYVSDIRRYIDYKRQAINITIQKNEKAGALSATAPEWIDVTQNTDGSLTFTAEYNERAEARSGTIIIHGEVQTYGYNEVFVVQSGNPDPKPVYYGACDVMNIEEYDDVLNEENNGQAFYVGSGKNVEVTTDVGYKYIWFVLNSLHHVTSWINSIVQTEDLYSLDEIQFKEIGSHYLFYYQAPIKIGTSYTVTIHRDKY